MRKILTLLFIVPVFVMGQKHRVLHSILTDTIAIRFDTIGIISAVTGYTTTPYLTLDTSRIIITPKYDTIPVSLMISDSTARYMYLGDTIGVDVSHVVYYVKAYSVREQKIRSHIYNTIGLQTMEEYMEHQYYLTEDKKPIPKGWVVWISK
jgi:hypothetical protein